MPFVAVAVFGSMAVEARRAARNERAQLARGGVEAPGDVYRIMRVVYPGAFLAMLAEGVWRGTPAAGLVIAGAVLFGAAKVLKWWAITALGPFWTFRVITIPGSTRVASGPYRFLNHPNYVAVAGELVSVALLTGSAVAGPAMTVAFGLLIRVRVRVEDRALAGAILPPRAELPRRRPWKEQP